MPLTLYASKKLADHLLALIAFTQPTALWLGLHTADPTSAGLFTSEISLSGTGYGRIDVTSAFDPADASTGICLLSSTIETGAASTDWGTVTHISVSDAETGGNMLFYGALSESETVLSGAKFQRSAGQIQLQLTL